MKFNLKYLYRTAFWVSLSGILIFILDFGFTQSNFSQSVFNGYYYFVLFIGLLATALRYINDRDFINRRAFIFDLITVLYTVLILFLHFFHKEYLDEVYIHNDNWIKFAVFFTFIREFSELNVNYSRTIFNPAQLFILSFLSIILIGSFLLMLPRATHSGISYINALFTSTSAVCVTGLAVVDIGSYFTKFGQAIILMLIQIGGLGILTFASYFSYFFKGGSTYENQLMLSDMTSSEKMGEVFSTLKHILVITFSIEFISGIIIYFSLDPAMFHSVIDQIFFAVFHSVSAFCNAGFSTLSNSLYQTGFSHNYLLQTIIALTFIIGGLGFPIVVNTLNYLKYKLLTLFFIPKKKKEYKPWILSINSRITLITTFSITAVAVLLFFVFEYNNTLSEHSAFGKVVTAFFGATTPRTAGFNSVDTSMLTFPTIMMIFLLMWIGASPSSTGGGIKTSTFAIATLNILSLAKGKSRVEVFRREIADISVRRAFATISLSLIVIGFGIMAISAFDGDKKLIKIAFECFSAYGTVGLSLGITSSLSSISKFVLIVLMFVGRVSMLSIMIAVVKKIKHKNYNYPTEEIMIN